jgi:hypothetical protein
MHRRNTATAIAVWAWLIGTSEIARAEVVSFNFTGEIISRQDNSGFLANGFMSGSRFAGTVSYDTADAGPDWYPDETFRSLHFFDSSFNLAVSADGWTFRSGSAGDIYVVDVPVLLQTELENRGVRLSYKPNT